MSNFFGADVDQLRELGRQLTEQADAVDGTVARLSARISGVAWHGPDAQRFTSNWNDRLAVDLRRVSEGLRASGSAAQLNAKDQHETSSGSSAGASGGSGGGVVAPVPAELPTDGEAVTLPAILPEDLPKPGFMPRGGGSGTAPGLSPEPNFFRPPEDSDPVNGFTPPQHFPTPEDVRGRPVPFFDQSISIPEDDPLYLATPPRNLPNLPPVDVQPIIDPGDLIEPGGAGWSELNKRPNTKSYRIAEEL